MSFERWKDTAIIIPARNEAERIGTKRNSCTRLGKE